MSTDTQAVTAETLNELDTFVPFTVNGDGTITVHHGMEWPTVTGNQDNDELSITDTSQPWKVFSAGYTGQYGYNGPVLHDSEYLGGRLAEDILSTPATYVVSPVYWDCTTCTEDDHLDAEDCEQDIEGWVVLQLTR